MKIIEVKGKILRTGNYHVNSVSESGEDLEINTPSLLVNLLSLKKKIRESLFKGHGFGYTFPITLDPIPETNGFKATFPLIFE